MDSKDSHTLVIGAGPAGLTAAYELARHGRAVTVLEAHPALVGGISRTETRNGYRFDIGGHRFFSRSSEINALWDELLPGLLERPRLSRIYFGGRFYDYPLDAMQALRNLGLRESAACMASFLWARLFPIAEPRTFHAWVRNAFGERLFGLFFKTYTEKVWGLSCDEISSDWAAQRIKGLDLGEAVLDALRRRAGMAGSGAKSLIGTFRYPELGPGMMWEAASSAIRQLGGRVIMGAEVTALRKDGAGWSVETGRGTFRGDDVVSTAALRDLAGMIDPKPAFASAAEGLRYRDFLTVALVLDRAGIFPDNWVYIHDPSVRVGRIQNFESWSPALIGRAGTSCLGLEYFCQEGDGLWEMRDDELAMLAATELGTIGLAGGASVVESHVVRQAKAYPVYDDGYKAKVDTVRRGVEALGGLHLAGRNGMHRYDNQDHAMMTGLLAARNVMAGRPVADPWAVDEDAGYLESAPAPDVAAALSSLRDVPARVPTGEPS